MDCQVVPHPKLKRDYPGRTVRLTRELANGYVVLPKGTVAVVTSQSPKGSTLTCEACKCCGMKAIISAISAEDIEFIEPVMKTAENHA